MGGLSNAIVDMASAGIRKVGTAIGKSHAAGEFAEHVESGMYHAIFKSEAAFRDIPVAKTLWEGYKGPYQEHVSKFTAQETQAAIQAGSSKPAHEIEQEARKKASDLVFGPRREVIQGVLKHVEKTSGKNRADILADHLNILFKEAPKTAGRNKGKSDFDIDMAERGPEEGRFDGPPTKYRGVSQLERVARVHQRTLAYKAAIPHLASNLNIMMSDGFQTYARVLAKTFGPGRKAAEAQVLATNAIGEMVMNGYKEKQAFDKGIIKQFAPGSVGEFLHRNMFIPGMSSVRYNTLLMSAHASKIAAEEAAFHLMKGKTKLALPMLHELGLDPNKILAQKGILDPEDIAKAYYHGTNTRAFLNQGDHRTILGQRSSAFRIMGAFHTYVSNQAHFFRQTFKRQFQQGDFTGIARNIGLIATVFPVVGATIYESERLLSGNDWDDPTGHLANRVEATPLGVAYDEVTGRNNSISKARVVLNTIDTLSHLASFGVVTGYIRGASRANLAGQILGPDANMAIQGTQDAVKALHTDNNHTDSWKPLARDIMSDTPSLGIGSIMSHEILPTKADAVKKEGKYKRYKRPSNKEDSWNPLNSNDFKY